MVDLFVGASRSDVKELINAAYNGSGDKFLDRWLNATGLKKEQLPKYYFQLLKEVHKMMAIDLQDTVLVDKLKHAGVPEDKLGTRVTFLKNEVFEANKRDAASAAFDAAGGSVLVSIEHDGTPRMMTADVDLVKIAADVGVELVIKPYRNKEQILEALKLYDPSIPAAFWDEVEVHWEEKAMVHTKVMSYLMQPKKDDRQCPLVFAEALKFLVLPTKMGPLPVSELFASVPQNKSSLYLWRWTWKWMQSPAAVHQGYLVDQCKALVQELMGPGNHVQLEMKSMFECAVSHLIKTTLYQPTLVNEFDSNHDLILFNCGRALHRDTKELRPTGPSDRMTLSTGYPFPDAAIADLREKLVAANLDLGAIFKSLHVREELASWEQFPADTIAKLEQVCKILVGVGDVHELYAPSWPLTLHVMKFIASLFFSRGNEENGFPLGEGMNGKSWLMFMLDKLLGEYACCVQAGLYSQPVPSTRTPSPDWLSLMGKKAFLGGEKGCDLKIDAGTFKALRDPTNVVELRGQPSPKTRM